jgi:hypothetical protein
MRMLEFRRFRYHHRAACFYYGAGALSPFPLPPSEPLMPVTDASKTVKFLGRLSVPLVVAFTGLDGFVFSNASPYPVGSAGHWNSGLGAWDGTFGWVAGSNTKGVAGITTFHLGNVTGTDNNWHPSTWWNGVLFGPFSQEEGVSQNNEKVFGFTQAVPLSSPDVVAAFAATTLITFPATSSRWPLSNTNGGFYGNADGTATIITTFNGLTSYFQSNSLGGCTLISNNSPLVWSSAQSIQSMIGFGGLYYISATGNVAPNNWLIVTDLGADAVRYALTYASPDGAFDMNTVLKNGQGAFQTCALGFLFFAQTVVNIGGIPYTGFGILILPDFSGYYLIQVLPQSIPAQDWANPARGLPIGKLDAVGNLYIQTANISGTLYFGGTLRPEITVYPSLPLIPVPHNSGILK